MIDYAIARETMEKQHIIAFWVNNLRMAADVLTKLKGDVRPLFEILEGGTYQIKVCLESGTQGNSAEKPRSQRSATVTRSPAMHATKMQKGINMTPCWVTLGCIR